MYAIALRPAAQKRTQRRLLTATAEGTTSRNTAPDSRQWLTKAHIRVLGCPALTPLVWLRIVIEALSKFCSEQLTKALFHVLHTQQEHEEAQHGGQNDRGYHVDNKKAVVTRHLREPCSSYVRVAALADAYIACYLLVCPGWFGLPCGTVTDQQP
jgi:hypothetical protein